MHKLKKTWGVMIFIIFVILCYFLLHSPEHEPLGSHSTDSVIASNPARHESDSTAASKSVDSGANSRVAVPTDKAKEDNITSLRICISCGSSPTVGVQVQVICWGESEPILRSRVAISDERGETIFTGLPVGKVSVQCGLGRSASVIVKKGEEVRLDLHAIRFISMSGRVLDQEGDPVPYASLVSKEGLHAGNADNQGRFRIDCIEIGTSLLAKAPGYSHSTPYTIDGAQTSVNFVLPDRGCTLSGSIKDSIGKTVSDSPVLVYLDSTEKHTAGTRPNGFSQPFSTMLRSDHNGMFVMDYLPRGKVTVIARSEGYAAWRGSFELTSDSATTCDIVLNPGSILEGVVLSKDRKPVEGAIVGVEPLAGFETPLVLSDQHGRFKLTGVSCSEVTVRAEHLQRGTVQKTFKLGEGTTTWWEAVLSRGNEIIGKVIDSDGKPLSGFFVVAVGSAKTSNIVISHDKIDETGAFALAQCLNGPNRLEIRRDGFVQNSTVFSQDEIHPGGSEIILIVPKGALAVAFFSGVVMDENGQPVPNATVAIRKIGNSFSEVCNVDAKTGSFGSGPLVSGSYKITIKAPNMATLQLGDRDLTAPNSTNLGTIILESAKQLRVLITDKNGIPIGFSLICRLCDKNNRVLQTLTAKNGFVTFESLGRGTYFVRIELGKDKKLVERSVDIERETDITIQLNQ